MDPALKVYLDKLHVETKAQTGDILTLLQDLETLFSKFNTVVSSRQLASSTVVAFHGDTSVVAIVPDVSCSTTKAQEVLEVIHNASSTSITMSPIPYLTDGPNQVITTAIINEVRDVATTVCPEPAVDLDANEVEQITPTRATSSIDSDTSSITKEVLRSSPTSIPSPTCKNARSSHWWRQPLMPSLSGFSW